VSKLNERSKTLPAWRSSNWTNLYYIKSYLTFGADLARRSLIENLYKKVNGTLDGLDDKMGPRFFFSRANANSFAISTVRILVSQKKRQERQKLDCSFMRSIVLAINGCLPPTSTNVSGG
jgi:hypothetical protein